MIQKLKQKLSERLLTFFLSRVKEYDYQYFGMLTSTTDACTDYRPIDLANKMVDDCMSMIAEYKPEDIE